MSAVKTEIDGEIRAQLDGIVRNLRSDLEVWNHCHFAGLSLVNDLAKLHSEYLTKTRHLEKDITGRLLLRRSRNEAKKSRERLLFLVDRLLDATENTRESLQQLRHLCSVNAMPGRIIYRKRELRDILEFVESIMILYDSEYEIKLMVVEELTNSKDNDEIQLIRQAWCKPRHALTTEFKSMFREFDLETIEVRPK